MQPTCRNIVRWGLMISTFTLESFLMKPNAIGPLKNSSSERNGSQFHIVSMFLNNTRNISNLKSRTTSPSRRPFKLEWSRKLSHWLMKERWGNAVTKKWIQLSAQWRSLSKSAKWSRAVISTSRRRDTTTNCRPWLFGTRLISNCNLKTIASSSTSVVTWKSMTAIHSATQ